MPDIPQEAVDAAVDAWHEAPRNENGAIALDDLMRHVLDGATPALAAQARRQVAEQIRDLAKWQMDGGFVNLFALVARHERLAHIDVTALSMALEALADEIGAGDDA